MSARVVLAVAVVLAAGSAGAADKARPRDGASAGSSRSAGESRHSGNRDSSPPSDRGSSSWSKPGNDASGTPVASSDRGRSRPPQTDAQRRHPRAGTGTGRFDNNGRRGNRNDFRFSWGSPYYGSRFGYGYGYGYYNPYDYWYSPYYYSGYYGYSPSYYGRGRGYGYYRDNGSLRIIVDPEKTRVYVDGYYAGIADDFDGILQRLNVPPGRHEITLKLEGYRTQHFKVYVPVGDTIKIHYDMVRGAGEATSEEFAGPPDADYARVRDMDDDDRGRGDDDRYRDDDRYQGRDGGRDDRRDQGDSGSVRLSVRPGDASVYVDGEFRGSGRQSANLRLRPGRHRIEVVRPGYRTVERDVEVRSGQNADLEFDLEKL